MSEKKLTKIMIVAGEQSGDILGAGLIEQIKRLFPDCQFCGIGGERMLKLGFESYYPMDRLSVMGFVEPLKRLPELLRMRAKVKRELKDTAPDIFVGIDSPDFNRNIEAEAKKLGILSVHYVSPSVWAWRRGRIKKIKKSVDLMLTLFPFEADLYREHDVDVCFVGHPLADAFKLEPDQVTARDKLGIKHAIPLCALMPGSRKFEVGFLLPVMLDVAQRLKTEFPAIEFVLPAANANRFEEVTTLLADAGEDCIHLLNGQSHVAMEAADFVIMASGTTTLEAMLLKRPMIITYKWPRLTWEILSRMVKVNYVGLPNLLAGKEVAPELLQAEATSEKVLAHARELVIAQSANEENETVRCFHDLHIALRRNASQKAAQAIVERWSA